MLGDVNNKVSTAQAITVTAFSTSSIDRLARQDFGAGSEVAFCFRISTTFTPAATGTLPAGIAVTFTDTGDLVTLATHGLKPGDRVTFVTVVTTTGLTVGRIYYVNTVPSANTFTLSATLAGVGGTPVALTTDGTGTMFGLPTIEFQVIAGDIDTFDASADPSLADILVCGSSGPIAQRGLRTLETVTNGTDLLTSTNHNLATGDPIVFTVQSGGVIPTGLVAGQVYFVVKIDGDTFKVALTRANADAGIVVDITANGTLPVAWSLADGALTLGGQLVHVKFNPQESMGKRYIGARYVVSGLFGGGAVDATLELAASQDMKPYPSGWSV